MACSRVVFQNATPSPYARDNRYPSQIFAAKSILRLKKQSLSCSPVRVNVPIKKHASPVVYAAHSGFSKGWKAVKDGIEATIDLVPDAIPRLIARAAVYYFAVKLALKLIRSASFYSLAVMGLAYFFFGPWNNGLGFPEEELKVDIIKTGINLVPDAIPRPIARVAVYYLALTLALQIIRSTSFFTLALMGRAYFFFESWNKSYERHCKFWISKEGDMITFHWEEVRTSRRVRNLPQSKSPNEASIREFSFLTV